MKKQSGFSLMQAFAGMVLLGMLAVVGFKLIPVYTEYFAVKRSLQRVAIEQKGLPVAQIRESFDKYAQIESISSVHGQDLEIESDNEGMDLHVEYFREVSLVANISLKFNFKADGRSSGNAK
ncbi:DUF4845 domain-containing protein [Burkholderiaceae bacterium DAT-1]|nr:DUF4845 domain-containing protein [Burkholderiaceae bacterium DAT-1]